MRREGMKCPTFKIPGARVAVLALLGAAPALAQNNPSSDRIDQKDKELGERLIRKVVTDAQEDVMDAVIRLMNEATRKLEIEFDAGEKTQSLQQDITRQLDEAIKIAASQRRPRRTSSRSTSDKRRGSSTDPDKSGRHSDSKEQNESAESAKTTKTARTDVDDDGSGGELREMRRAWGHLPMREREEVIQGVSERFLERYRSWIERYYRALQETED